jgi:Inositol polyphosphate kinase.
MRIRVEIIRRQSLNVILNITQNLILMAGHVGNFRKIAEGRKIAKRTNQEEYEIYNNPGGLQDIIPFTERTNQDNQEISDMGENIIIMQNLFYGIQAQSLVALDIKIGKSTASRSQLSGSEEKNQTGAFFKKIKMGLYDRYTKSSTRGWRAIPVDDGNRAKIGRNSETFLQEQLDRIKVNKGVALRRIITQLNLIKDRLDQNQKTFIASSVLIVIDLQRPENACVKLIDLAYPIDASSKLYQKYKENFDEGISALITFLKLIQ